MAKGSLVEDNVVYGALPQRDIEAFGAVAPRRQASNRRITMIAGAVAMAMALTALIFVVATPAEESAPPAAMQWQSLAQKAVRTTKLQEDAGSEEAGSGADAGSGDAEAVHEPGFVIATTDDSSPPPVASGATFHHIKNFAGTEQMMNNGEVVGAGVHVASGIGSGDGVTVGSGVINGQGVTVGSGEGMGTGMFAGSGEGTGMMVGVGSGVGSGHMITVGDGFVEGKGILENYEGHDMFIVSGSGSGTGISVTDGYGSGTNLTAGHGEGSGSDVSVANGTGSGDSVFVGS